MQAWTPQRVSDICGIDASQLEAVARAWGHSPAGLSAWSMGVNQSQEGSAPLRAVVNYHLRTGQMVRAVAAHVSPPGHPNARGGRWTPASPSPDSRVGLVRVAESRRGGVWLLGLGVRPSAAASRLTLQ